MSRGKLQFLIFLFGFVLGAVLLAGGAILYNKLVDSGKLQSASLPLQVTDVRETTKVLVALQRIEKGDELKPEFFQLSERNPDEVPTNSIIDSNLITGERAASIIDKMEILTDSKLLSSRNTYNPDDRLKDYALQGYLVADTVRAGDWIDVEFIRSNGDTFVVLSKKQVAQLKENKAIIQVSTEERSLINHAIAEQSSGMGHVESILYLDEKQPASKVTYIPAKLDASDPVASAAEIPKSAPATEISTGSVPSSSTSSVSAPNASTSTESSQIKADTTVSNAQKTVKPAGSQKKATGKITDSKQVQGGRTRQ